MKRRLIKTIKSESGQALPIVLILLVLGGLLIAPCLSYASTNLNSGRVVEKNIYGLYAADAGIEDALWRLKNDPPAAYPYSYQLPDVNGLSVTVLTEQVTILYSVLVGSPGQHSDYIEVIGGMTYDEELGVYLYSANITNKQSSVMHIDKILVNLPPNFEYIPGSTSGSFTTDDPEIKGDPDSGVTLVWDFQPPLPSIEGAPDPEHGCYSTVTETFELSGPPGYSGSDDYLWVVANREDIGCVGEANAFKITAQAKDGETVIMTVKAGALIGIGAGELLVSCWEINPPPVEE